MTPKVLKDAVNYNALIYNQLKGLVDYSLRPDNETMQEVNKHLSEVYGLLGNLDAWSKAKTKRCL